MTATYSQAKRLRADIGANEDSLPSTEIDDIFDEAAESYTTAAEIKAYTRIIAIRRLKANAAKLTTYRQNQSSENLSDVFKHLDGLLRDWQGELASATMTGQSVVKFGQPRRIPRRIAEFPDNDRPRRLVK